jgi:hypothetical protein
VELVSGPFEQALPRLKTRFICESADVGLIPEDREKDGAGEEGRTPDLMLGKHTL